MKKINLNGHKIDKSDLTYGETPYFTLEKVLDHIGIKNNDVFYDLGSGKGKLVYFTARRYKITAIGIEIFPSFVKTAKHIANIFTNEKCSFINDDFFNVDISDATIVFVVGTSFSYETEARLIKKILETKPGTKIITTNFPLQNQQIHRLEDFRVCFGWGMGQVFIHSVKSPGV
ncbi:methyltransferase domain-containing protein [Candidatus Margulisiibacteriota bacterium]